MTHTASFEQLMAEVATGSEDAMWELAETFTPYIIRSVRASLSPVLRQKLDSQDFAQTLWGSLLLRRTELARLKTPEQLIAFLARAARNKVIDASRHLNAQKCDVRREQSLEQFSAGRGRSPQYRQDPALYTRDPTPSQFVSVRERWNRILANASERDRHILQLRLKGCTFDVISARLKINQSTARRAMD